MTQKKCKYNVMSFISIILQVHIFLTVINVSILKLYQTKIIVYPPIIKDWNWNFILTAFLNRVPAYSCTALNILYFYLNKILKIRIIAAILISTVLRIPAITSRVLTASAVPNLYWSLPHAYIILLYQTISERLRHNIILCPSNKMPIMFLSACPISHDYNMTCLNEILVLFW